MLQVYILQPILGDKQAIAWANILITRPYRLPRAAEKELGRKYVHYAVGQPMGALSS